MGSTWQNRGGAALLGQVCRLNPVLELITVDKLTDQQRRKLAHFLRDRKVYGFLHAPADAKLTVKSVNRDLAEFLLAMAEPAKLGDVLDRYGRGSQEEKASFVVQLVLEGVLEVNAGEEYISGVAALNRILSPTGVASGEGLGISDEESKTWTQRLSEGAIRLAFASALTQPRDITFVLYNFNRIPTTRRRRRALPDEAAVADYLGINADGVWPGMPSRVHQKPVRVRDDGSMNGFDVFWRSWRIGERTSAAEKPTYKVYYSALPEDLPEVFRIVREAACQSEARSMKIGRVLAGLLRPDKLIVYFSRYPEAREFALSMSRRLRDFKGQGNPFSFQVNPEHALVTMGVDPPRKLDEFLSWRVYVTGKLALAIQGARRDQTRDALAYVADYLRLLGVDGRSWSPLSEDWSMQFYVEEE